MLMFCWMQSRSDMVQDMSLSLFDAGSSANFLGKICTCQGKYFRAKRRAFAVLGVPHSDCLESDLALAQLHKNAGDYDHTFLKTRACGEAAGGTWSVVPISVFWPLDFKFYRLE
jgi:hypothetical protein